MSDQVKPLYDLSTIPQRDAENVCAEVLRNIFIDTIENLDKAGETEKENMVKFLEALEHVIFVVEGNDDFLKFVTQGSEKSESDDPFEQ